MTALSWVSLCVRAQAAETAFVASTEVVADTAWDRPAEDVVESWTRLRGRASDEANRGRW